MVFFKRNGRNGRRFTNGRRRHRNGFAKSNARAIASKALTLSRHVAFTRPKPEMKTFTRGVVTDQTIAAGGALSISMNYVLTGTVDGTREGAKIREWGQDIRFHLFSLKEVAVGNYEDSSYVSVMLIRFKSQLDQTGHPSPLALQVDSDNSTASFFNRPKDTAWTVPYEVVWRRTYVLGPRLDDGGTGSTNSIFPGTSGMAGGSSARQFVTIQTKDPHTVVYDVDANFINDNGEVLYIQNDNFSGSSIRVEFWQHRMSYTDT